MVDNDWIILSPWNHTPARNPRCSRAWNHICIHMLRPWDEGVKQSWMDNAKGLRLCKKDHGIASVGSGWKFLINSNEIRRLVIWLVVWSPLKNISQLGWLFHIYGKIKNVPNHQPVIACNCTSLRIPNELRITWFIDSTAGSSWNSPVFAAWNMSPERLPSPKNT